MKFSIVSWSSGYKPLHACSKYPKPKIAPTKYAPILPQGFVSNKFYKIEKLSQ